MTDGARARRSSQGGRLALILAAERLIALRGLSGVSLREINEAAGFRNVAASHYHFGSRDGVLEGVFAHRLSALEARREAYIHELKTAGEVSNVRGLIGALVWPLVEELRPRPEGNYYLRFLEQCKREREDSPLIAHGHEMASTWAWITAQLRRHLKHLPPQIATLRLRLEYVHMISGLASIEAWIEQGELSPGDLHLAAEVLIDGVVCAILSPATPETLKRLRGAPDAAA